MKDHDAKLSSRVSGTILLPFSDQSCAEQTLSSYGTARPRPFLERPGQDVGAFLRAFFISGGEIGVMMRS